MNTSRVPVKSANGLRGSLLRLFDGSYCFRIYNGQDFVDYNIMSYDLSVVIEDEDAFIYGNNVIDHSPETLGYE